MPVTVSPEQFEEAVADALDDVPPELLDMAENLVFVVEAEPPSDTPDLLGLYEGTPLTERDTWTVGVLPDRISIYSGPLCRSCDDVDDLREQISITVVHELAHHFGIDDDALDEWGWG